MTNVKTQSENTVHPEPLIASPFPPEAGPIVRVDNVSRIYHVGATEVKAVRELSLAVPAGVFASLKGRSGSGKTTLLRSDRRVGPAYSRRDIPLWETHLTHVGG